MSTVQAFDYSVNLLQNIIWQYDQSPNLVAVVRAKHDWYAPNQTEFWTNWYSDVFNLLTANDFGLAVWAVILDVPIFVDNGGSPPGYPAFGFADYGENFGHGNFGTAGSGMLLTTAERRAILRLRYHQLTTIGSVSSINAALADVFGSGNAHVVDNRDMTITYTFTTPISAPLLSVLQSFDVMPRPAGVSIDFDN